MNFFVYCHTNKNNGKRYVGLCSTSIEIRWEQHCKSSRSKRRSYFHNAIRKWGTSSLIWSHEILERMTTFNGAKIAEKLWIKELKTFAYDDGSLGYNETRGGDGTLGMKHSLETRKFLSDINSGKNNPNFGKIGANKDRKFSQETKEKMRNAHLGKKRSAEFCKQFSEKQKRSVLQITLDGHILKEFPSLNDARSSIKEGQKSSIIGECCRGKREFAHGFRWKFKNEF